MSDGVVKSFERLMHWVELHYVPKTELRKKIDEWRKQHKDEHYYHADFFADDLEELLK